MSLDIIKRLQNKKNRKLLLYSGLALLLILILFLFNKYLMSVIFTSILFIIGCLSKLFNKVAGELNLGIESLAFVTIIFIYAHGIFFGLIACLAMMLITTFLFGQVSMNIFARYSVFVLAGLLSIFFNFGIALNGIILIIIVDIVYFIMMLFLDGNVSKHLLFSAGNIFLNIVIFHYFGNIVYSLL